MNETYYVKTEEKQHTVKIQNKDEKFYSYDGELVEDPTGTLVEKTITENGEYLPIDDDADGYSKVTVSVPIPVVNNKLPQLVDKTVTSLTADDLAGATKIGSYSISECQLLQSVVVPDSVTVIENRAFGFCVSSLLTITVGTGITSIGTEAFIRTDHLNSITILNPVPPTIMANTFNGMNNKHYVIYVPAESVSAYQSATNWSSIASRIQAIPA